MRIALKQNLFLGGQRYRADPGGVDLPDFVDGKKLVLKEDWVKAGRPEDQIPLPEDAEIYKYPVEGIKSLVSRNKTIPPQFPVNPTQSPPPGPTPTEGSASMAIDMVDAEKLVDDMNNPKTKSLTTDEALEKVERDNAKALAEQERAKSEATVEKAQDRQALDHAVRRDQPAPMKSPDTLSGLTRAAEKEQVKDPKTLSEMHKGSSPTIKK